MSVDWSSLPPDLVRRLGDHHLAAGDIDYYMDMRSVCHSWRSAILKPRPLGVGADRRFRPRHWVMLDVDESKVAADSRRLFVNVSTGRFLRRRVPVLDDHRLLASSAGLLVLREKSSPHATCVLDPFTGAVLPAPKVHEEDFITTVYIVADPASDLRVVKFPRNSDGRPLTVHSKVTHAGHVYVVDGEGCVFRILDTEERLANGFVELIAKTAIGGDMHLVESAGELLVIRLSPFGCGPEVFRVDVERKVLVSLHSIGRRALFLGCVWCLSVDADKFPSIHPNCVYYYRELFHEAELFIRCETYRYNLSNDGREEDVSDFRNVKPGACLIGPVSLANVLLEYCNFFADL